MISNKPQSQTWRYQNPWISLSKIPLPPPTPDFSAGEEERGRGVSVWIGAKKGSDWARFMPRIWIARREGLQRGPPHRIATSPAQYAQQGDPAVNELEQGVGASYLIWENNYRRNCQVSVSAWQSCNTSLQCWLLSCHLLRSSWKCAQSWEHVSISSHDDNGP